MILYLSRVHRVEFISMEVDIPASLFASLEDSPTGVCVKHTLLTEHINVVYME